MVDTYLTIHAILIHLGKSYLATQNPTRLYAILSKSLALDIILHGTFLFNHLHSSLEEFYWNIFHKIFHIISSNLPYTTQPYTWQISIKPYNLYIVGKISFVHFSQISPYLIPNLHFTNHLPHSISLTNLYLFYLHGPLHWSNFYKAP